MNVFCFVSGLPYLSILVSLLTLRASSASFKCLVVSPLSLLWFRFILTKTSINLYRLVGICFTWSLTQPWISTSAAFAFTLTHAIYNSIFIYLVTVLAHFGHANIRVRLLAFQYHSFVSYTLSYSTGSIGAVLSVEVHAQLGSRCPRRQAAQTSGGWVWKTGSPQRMQQPGCKSRITLYLNVRFWKTNCLQVLINALRKTPLTTYMWVHYNYNSTDEEQRQQSPHILVQVLNSIPEKKRAIALQQIDLTSAKLPADRTLGTIWNMETD